MLTLVPPLFSLFLGRLRHHIESADPPAIGRALYLVLDEADRLLAPGFSSEIQIILNAMHPNRYCDAYLSCFHSFSLLFHIMSYQPIHTSPPTSRITSLITSLITPLHITINRQTLLFSATMTASLSELEKLAAHDTVHFDLTSSSSSSSSSSRSRGKGKGDGDGVDNDDDNDNQPGVQRMPSRLKQEFLFMPAQVHTSQSNSQSNDAQSNSLSIITALINTQ